MNIPKVKTVAGLRVIELARHGYALYRSEDGKYYAGCRRGLSYKQAAYHWDDGFRHDQRAMYFAFALGMFKHMKP